MLTITGTEGKMVLSDVGHFRGVARDLKIEIESRTANLVAMTIEGCHFELKGGSTLIIRDSFISDCKFFGDGMVMIENSIAQICGFAATEVAVYECIAENPYAPLIKPEKEGIKYISSLVLNTVDTNHPAIGSTTIVRSNSYGLYPLALDDRGYQLFARKTTKEIFRVPFSESMSVRDYLQDFHNRMEEAEWRYTAGCRDFDYEMAFDHWGDPEYEDRRRGQAFVDAVRRFHESNKGDLEDVYSRLKVTMPRFLAGVDNRSKSGGFTKLDGTILFDDQGVIVMGQHEE